MGRRRLWIIGGAVLVLAFVVLVVLDHLPLGPFRFLDGHQPLERGTMHARNMGLSGAHDSAYSFRADWEAFLPSAQAELVGRGYELVPESKEYKTLRFERLDPLSKDQEMVDLVADQRIDFVGDGKFGGLLEEEKGWVTVYVFLNRAPSISFTDQIKAALGL